MCGQIPLNPPIDEIEVIDRVAGHASHVKSRGLILTMKNFVHHDPFNGNSGSLNGGIFGLYMVDTSNESVPEVVSDPYPHAFVKTNMIWLSH